MKQIFLIALVLVIAVTFAFAAFQAPSAGDFAAHPPESVSFFVRPPGPLPNVGWNS